jgi:hypothetical protein
MQNSVRGIKRPSARSTSADPIPCADALKWFSVATKEAVRENDARGR